ncbi:hypothetical protein CsatB_018014 [Cannabis sativa]
MAQGGGLLPSGIVQDALGFYTLPQKEFFKRDYITSSVAPSIWFFPFGFDFYAFSVLSSATNVVLIFWVSVETGFEEGVVLVQMVGSNTQAVEELIEEIENFCFDDFSIQVEPDNDLARDTVARTVVGRFFAKRGVSLGTLRRALSGMWKLTPGWCLQEPSPKTFVCRLNSPKEVKAVLENGPWNPCGGFLLVSALPENGDWKSANMEALDIWVKAHGVPLPFMTEECIANMASRMGTLLQANKVRRNGILAHDYLWFQVRINVKFSILAGVSLTDDRKKKWWCHLKYERLPILCFKCGVIGHDEAVCSGRKRMVSVQDGRSVPLFGPWLRDGSKLENGFALLEVDDIGDIQRLEKEDGPVSGETGVSDGAAGAVSGNSLGAVASPVGVTRVEKLGMEGVVTQNSEQTFSVAYNDYVDLSKFPTKHVMHVANIFKEKLGPIKFGATCGNEEERQSIMASVQKLNKPKLVGPRGIPKPPVFGRSFNSDKLVGSKRKKSLGKSSRRSDFVAESQGVCCIQVIDKTNIPDVSGETSGVNQSGGTFTRSSGEDSGKRYQIDMESLRSKEGSFGSILELGNQKEAVGIPIDNSGGVRVGVQPVWRSGPWGFCSDSMVFGDNLELVKWLLQPTGTPLGENDLVRFTIYAISLCFVLWRVRNSSFHEGLCPMVSKIQQEISSLVADCSLDRPSSLEMQGSIPAVAEENWRGLWTDVNVFVDAAIREEFGIVAIVVLDRSGTVIEAVTAKRKVPTPFVAELEAFFSGCCRILQSGWENVTIFSDCQTLVKSLAAGPSPEWRACGLFDATRNLLARLSHCQYR